jgi:hypothetical protein
MVRLSMFTVAESQALASRVGQVDNGMTITAFERTFGQYSTVAATGSMPEGLHVRARAPGPGKQRISTTSSLSTEKT